VQKGQPRGYERLSPDRIAASLNQTAIESERNYAGCAIACGNRNHGKD
jgi:hypothetical protein